MSDFAVIVGGSTIWILVVLSAVSALYARESVRINPAIKSFGMEFLKAFVVAAIMSGCLCAYASYQVEPLLP